MDDDTCGGEGKISMDGDISGGGGGSMDGDACGGEVGGSVDGADTSGGESA
jgi:hypothetical protein